MQDLRQALEQLDEALDRLEEQMDVRPVAPAAPTIRPRSPSEIYRTEIVRLLDSTIIDAQRMLEQAA